MATRRDSVASPDHVIALQKRAIEDGRITLNGDTVAPDTIVRNNDIILNRIHRCATLASAWCRATRHTLTLGHVVQA